VYVALGAVNFHRHFLERNADGHVHVAGLVGDDLGLRAPFRRLSRQGSDIQAGMHENVALLSFNISEAWAGRCEMFFRPFMTE